MVLTLQKSSGSATEKVCSMDKELQEKRELAKLLSEKERRIAYNRLEQFFPDAGLFARSKYSKHTQFMAAGSKFNQRAFVAANRTGKTVTGAYEMALHLTGLYPSWWEGRRFKTEISAWCASISNETTKNILQQELLGSPRDIGTGMIPKDCIVGNPVKKPGVADAIETVYIRHVSGGISRLDFKSYEQGRDTFQGTKKQVIWLDEEPTDPNIYTECLTRTAGAEGQEGLIYCTFTPLMGLSDVVLSFLPNGKIPENGVSEENPQKFVTQVTWEEVPHLSESWKQDALASYSQHERDARTKGVPALGSGAIYPYPEEMVFIDPIEIPFWWKKAYALDVGWNRTAGLWAALDPESKQIYVYSEHYVGKELPAVHASSIKSRGEWMTGAIDPRSDMRSQVDGTRLVDLYQQEGLHLVFADNSVEAGIYKVSQLLASGQLKIFKTLTNTLGEFRVYRRDENGKIVKKNDHLMDALRYLIMTGLDYAALPPDPDDYQNSWFSSQGQSDVTGY